MTDKSFSARLLKPAANVRNRLWAFRAGRAGVGARVEALPEPVHYGDADRGAGLLEGCWRVGAREIAFEGGSIWTARMPDARLEMPRESCEWLDDLAALETRAARALAQAWVLDWAQRCGAGRGPGWTPVATGRRAMRWVAHAAFLAGGLEDSAAERFWRALAAQQRYLERAWPKAEPGLPRMQALAGLVWIDHVLLREGQSAAVTALGGLAADAIDPEGGVASRNPEDLAETLALLIWTARLLENGGAAAAGPHLSAIVRAVPVLRQLRMGDGRLPRFHGGGAGDATAIDKALAELRLDSQPKARLPMGFARLTGGRVSVVLDGAAPPRGAWAAAAHASALAFEMSVGRQPVIGSVGPGRWFGAALAAAARRTAAHSTVEVAGASSARFAGLALTGGPTLVSVRQAKDATGMWLLATQDGYVERHGLLHERRIFVDARGQEVRGEEILTVTDARARAVYDRAARAADGRLPLAVRFHVHPAVGLELDPGPQVVRLELPSGEVWIFRAAGGAVSIEEATHLDLGFPEPRPALQVVVRAEVTEYLGQVTWSFARIAEPPRPA